jgi:hypothetical protein
MTPQEILAWGRAHGEPIPDACDRTAFRCAAWLDDGTYLPCVLLREATAHVQLARDLLERRVAEDFDAVYPSLLRSLVVSGSRVDEQRLARLETSPFAIPWSLLSTLPGQLNVSPMEFAAAMDDGAVFAFGTALDLAFFDMPPGYSGSRVRRVEPSAHPRGTTTFRERSCFVAFITGTDFTAP